MSAGGFMKQTGFIGFPDAKMKAVVIPDFFFTDLLPLIDDLAELKLTLHCFWLLNEQEGRLRYLRGSDLRGDDILLVEETVTRRWTALFATRRAVPVAFPPGGRLAAQVLGCDLHLDQVQLVELQVLIGISRLQRWSTSPWTFRKPTR